MPLGHAPLKSHGVANKNPKPGMGSRLLSCWSWESLGSSSNVDYCCSLQLPRREQTCAPLINTSHTSDPGLEDSSWICPDSLRPEDQLPQYRKLPREEGSLWSRLPVMPVNHSNDQLVTMVLKVTERHSHVGGNQEMPSGLKDVSTIGTPCLALETYSAARR